MENIKQSELKIEQIIVVGMSSMAIAIMNNLSLIRYRTSLNTQRTYQKKKDIQIANMQ